MTIYSNVTNVASLIGDTTRTTILMALLDGKALPAGELARLANVSPQTASNHLSKLVDGGLLTVEAWSRHRYYRLASPDVAKALESIASIAPPAPVRSLRQSDQAKALQFARTCYDHIAGYFGVEFTNALVQKGHLEDIEEGYFVTPQGKHWLADFGIDRAIKNDILPYHIDWSERVRHIAGPVAVAITKRLLQLGWIEHGRIRRSIVITEIGRTKLEQELDMKV